MMNLNPEVDNYIAAANDFAQPILRKFRTLVHQICPEVEEVIKWRFPCFEYKGLMCSMTAHKNHCSISFWKGKIIDDPHDILQVVGKTGMGNLGKITSLEDLPGDAILQEYIEKAIALNESGFKK